MNAHECHTGCDCHESARTLELDRLRATISRVQRCAELWAAKTEYDECAASCACVALRGAINAADKRLSDAGQRVGLDFGCDTAERMADEINRLRAQVSEALEAGAAIALTLAEVRGICNAADDTASDPDCTGLGLLARGRLAAEILEVLP